MRLDVTQWAQVREVTTGPGHWGVALRMTTTHEERTKIAAPQTSGEAAVDITPRVVAGEVRDFVRAHERRRRRQFPRAALVGLLAGLVAVAFRGVLDLAELGRNGLIAFGH